MSDPMRLDRVGSEAGAASMSEPEEVRTARLMKLQLEALGTARKDAISTSDYAENLLPPDLMLVEQRRRSNVPGTFEHEELRQDHGQISAWNNLYASIEDDGTVDEGLMDFYGGQTHRARLMQEIEQRGRHSPEVHRGSRSGRGGRAGGGGRGANQGHSWGPRRTPAGHSEAMEGANRPSVGYSSHHSEDPFVGNSGRSDGSLMRSAPSRVVPAHDISRASAPITNTPPSREPRVASWNSGLASPEVFMASMAPVQGTTPAGTQGAAAAKPAAATVMGTVNDQSQDTTPAVSQVSTATVTENVAGPVNIVGARASMTANSHGQDTTPAFSHGSGKSVTETLEAPATMVHPKDTGSKSHRPSYMEVIDEVSDVLISTDAGSSHGSLHSWEPLSQVEHRPSYSTDLIGLEIDSGPGSSLAVCAGSNESTRDHSRKASYIPTIDLVNEIENLIPVLLRSTDRDPIKRQIEELFVQVKANIPPAQPSFIDTKLNKPIPQVSAASTPQGQPEKYLEEPVSAANISEQNIPLAQVQTAHHEPSRKGKERASEDDMASEQVAASGLSVGTENYHEEPVSAANISEKNIPPAQVQTAHHEPNRKGKERASGDDMASEQVAARGLSVRTDIHNRPETRDEADFTTGAHIIPEEWSQSNRVRIESTGSTSGTTQGVAFATPAVRSPQDTLGPLAAGFARLSLENISREEPAPNLASINPFGSVASASSASRRSTTALPSSNPLLQGSQRILQVEGASNALMAIRSQSSGSRDASTIIPAIRPQLTDSDGSESDEDPRTLVERPPFFVASVPSRVGSMINRVGFFREENRSQTTMPTVTNNGPPSGNPVFRVTHVPSGPSMINRTGLFRESAAEG